MSMAADSGANGQRPATRLLGAAEPVLESVNLSWRDTSDTKLSTKLLTGRVNGVSARMGMRMTGRTG
jgi:hypothetical protein